MIYVNDEELNILKNALSNAGENYKSNLNKLNSLIEEITSGDIQGDPANDLLTKYKEKEEILKGLERTINEAEEYVGVKTNQFDDMITNLGSEMR